MTDVTGGLWFFGLIAAAIIGFAVWLSYWMARVERRFEDLEDQRHEDFGYLDSSDRHANRRLARLEADRDDPHGTRHLTGEGGDEYGIE